MNRAALPLVVALLAGCGDSQPPPAAEPGGLDPARVARGAEVYRANCANCHGARGEGASNWQKPGADGKYPAPPLDGSGHAWHHPKAALEKTIKDGTAIGGGMPAWRGKLSDQDIDAVVVWMQSLWPEEIYRAWLAMDGRSRQGNSASP